MSTRILVGDALSVLRTLPSESVHMCVTSPPYYGLRDYGVPGQIGLEATPELWCAAMVAVFREVRRVLRTNGTLWLNIGDSYAASPGQRKDTDAHGPKQATNFGANGVGSRSAPGIKPKDLIGIPWMLAFALRADGWYLRSEIIWHKPNPMPESVTDRPTKAHEQLFLLSKSRTYHYDADAIREPHDDKAGPAARFGNLGVNGGNNGQIAPDGFTRVDFAKRPGGREYNPAGRNKRSVFRTGAQYATLRRDLPPETRARVAAELAKRGLL